MNRILWFFPAKDWQLSTTCRLTELRRRSNVCFKLGVPEEEFFPLPFDLIVGLEISFALGGHFVDSIFFRGCTPQFGRRHRRNYVVVPSQPPASSFGLAHNQF